MSFVDFTALMSLSAIRYFCSESLISYTTYLFPCIMFYNFPVTVNEQIKKSEIVLFVFIHDAVKTYIYRFCVPNKCLLLTLLK